MTRTVGRSFAVLAMSIALLLSMAGVFAAQKAQAVSFYMISYELNGGVNPVSQTRIVMSGKTIKVSKLKKPTRTGYKFKGWYKDKKLKKKATAVKGSPNRSARVLYAKWAATSYKITYKLNGGKQVKGQTTKYTIATKTFKLKSPTRSGYDFKGWFSNKSFKSGTQVTKIAKGSIGKKTLYAKWRKAWDGKVDVDGVTVRQSTQDYSWEELSKISAAMTASNSESNAIKIAINYHLCSQAGKLTGNETKTLTLGANTPKERTATVQIVGFYHDPIDADNTAGITFMFTEAIGSTSVSNITWERSAIRSYVGEDLFSNLPADLSSVIVKVRKKTNNNVMTLPVTTSEGISTTTDALWLPSVVELTGKVPTHDWAGDPWYELTDPSNQAAIYNAEGSQYQFFKDAGVTANAASDVLVRTLNGIETCWLLRSTDPVYCYSAYVNAEEGNDVPLRTVIGGFGLSGMQGVVPAFCL